MQAVMMVAGKSTRTYPLTLTRPKPLLPVINRPLILYNLDQLVGLVEEVILIVGYRKEMIAETLGTEYRGLKLVYQEQVEQLGTGHAVLQAAPHVHGRFLVMNGDDLYAREDISRLLKYRYAALAKKVPDPSQYGVILTDSDSRITGLVEKPKKFVGDLANVGCYIFEPEIFSELETLPLSERGEIELTEAILNIARREPVYAVPLKGYWLPTGFPWDLLSTQQYLFHHLFEPRIEGKVAVQSDLVGAITVAEGAEVRPGAQIIGPAYIARNAVVGEQALILPYTTVGEGAVLGPKTLVENTIFLPKAVLEPGGIVRNSVVGEGAYLGEAVHFVSSPGPGEKVRSFVKGKWITTPYTQLGAFLGDEVQLGARTVVYPGCKIWPGIKVPPETAVKKDLLN